MGKNFGVQLLRMILCFWIVIFHCFKTKKKILRKYLFGKRFHVPCFVLISFFFSFNTFSGRNIIKIKKRFERIVIPYFVFPILILLINNISFNFFPKLRIFSRIITLKDLIFQFILGRQFIGVFWFQSFLIWSTLLFTIISFIFKKNLRIIINLLLVISYIIQYSNLNINLFHPFSAKIKLSVGCFAEVFPMSFLGSIISSNNLFEVNNKTKIILYSFISLLFILKYDVFSDINTFGFGGIKNHFGALLLFIIFYFLPMEEIKSDRFKKIIDQMTNYTQGIYSLHLIIKYIFNPKINYINNGSFLGCILIYIVKDIFI